MRSKLALKSILVDFKRHDTYKVRLMVMMSRLHNNIVHDLPSILFKMVLLDEFGEPFEVLLLIKLNLFAQSVVPLADVEVDGSCKPFVAPVVYKLCNREQPRIHNTYCFDTRFRPCRQNARAASKRMASKNNFILIYLGPAIKLHLVFEKCVPKHLVNHRDNLLASYFAS